MHEHNNIPSELENEDRHKGKHFEGQMKKVFAAFERNPSTMLMVSIQTGILRANICRYVSIWKRQGKIKHLKFGLCKISKHPAGYYTTNPELFPVINPSNTGRI
jgi:hypothetical protein